MSGGRAGRGRAGGTPGTRARSGAATTGGGAQAGAKDGTGARRSPGTNPAPGSRPGPGVKPGPGAEAGTAAKPMAAIRVAPGAVAGSGPRGRRSSARGGAAAGSDGVPAGSDAGRSQRGDVRAGTAGSAVQDVEPAPAAAGPGALRRSRPPRATRSHAAPRAADPRPAAAAGELRGERIAKWLAHAGVASRRDAEKLLAEGRVRLNNAVVKHPATFVGEGDLVQVGGVLVEPPGRTRLWRYHKPDGLVTTHRDPEGRPTVFASLPPGMPRVVSVGRLDLNSEGLLLLTTDGGLARRLEMPANGWLRRYRVRVYGIVDEARLAALGQGVEVEGVRYGPIEAGLDSRRGNNAWVSVGLREGRNREVRRVMEHLGLRVTRLIRTAYGPFQLGLLTRGSVEEVTAKVLREQVPEG